MADERGWQMTARDEEILEWVARWRAVTAPQVQREFTRRAPDRPLHIKKAERRLRALKELGLVQYRRFRHGAHGVYWVSREGAKHLGVVGAVAPPKAGELEHDLDVVDLGFHLHELQPTQQLVTEQEIRRLEPSPSAGPGAALRADIELGAGRGSGGVGFPDLASVLGGEVWVHELERSWKGRLRVERVMLSYVHAEHVSGVVYWAYPQVRGLLEAAAGEVNQAAATLGTGCRILVRPWKAQG
jgi:hypothetical protein